MHLNPATSGLSPLHENYSTVHVVMPMMVNLDSED